MTKRAAVGIGLAVGGALGLYVRARMLQAPTPEIRRAMMEAAVELLKREIPPPLPTRLRLADQDRRGRRLPRSDYHRVWLERVDFRRADLREADFSDAWIHGCDFRGANMEHADLSAALYDAATLWPAGFDPREHGARLGDTSNATGGDL